MVVVYRLWASHLYSSDTALWRGEGSQGFRKPTDVPFEASVLGIPSATCLCGVSWLLRQGDRLFTKWCPVGRITHQKSLSLSFLARFLSFFFIHFFCPFRYFLSFSLN